jgi:hypothetical protein
MDKAENEQAAAGGNGLHAWPRGHPAMDHRTFSIGGIVGPTGYVGVLHFRHTHNADRDQ